ncbi:helix-turn-helix domain-containing protein [Streptomyces sp. NPDC004074]|uniref:TetR/AcrR family transcriptional regulator n=1 Tax=unclassified Streptomyces TaxID=2593676 RepID=UPI0033A27883
MSANERNESGSCVTAARERAEAESWDAVTTRRLAAEIEYSRPVPYSHFRGKDAITAAVVSRASRTWPPSPSRTSRTWHANSAHGAHLGVLTARGAHGGRPGAYADFRGRRPALCEVMFTHAVDVPFATAEAPAPRRAAFAEPRPAVAPLAAEEDPGVVTETLWAGPHGLLTLMHSGRLPRETARPPAGPPDRPLLPGSGGVTGYNSRCAS